LNIQSLKSDLCLSLALTLTLSPREREQQLDASGFAKDYPANSAIGHFKNAVSDSPSPWGEGRDEG
jgi:hypothetical protein